jgi:hypothetical protein
MGRRIVRWERFPISVGRARVATGHVCRSEQAVTFARESFGIVVTGSAPFATSVGGLCFPASACRVQILYAVGKKRVGLCLKVR